MVTDANERLVRYDGTPWTAPAKPIMGAVSRDILFAQCVSAQFCYSTAGTFNGSTWTAWPTNSPARYADRLACTSPTFCIETEYGENGAVIASRFNGTAWSKTQYVGGSQVAYGEYPACASPQLCVDAELRTSGVSMYPGPAITSMTPPFGGIHGGTIVHLTGQRLQTVTQVYFGSQRATSFTIDSPTSLTAVTPPRAVGRVWSPSAHLSERPHRSSARYTASTSCR